MSEYPAIRAYLDELARQLVARSPECGRMLSEAKDHLIEAVGQMLAEGMPMEEAERTAVARFGTASEVAACWANSRDFAPDQKGRLRWTAVPVAAVLLLIAAVILFIGNRGSGERRAAAKPSARANAFTAVKVETVYSESGEIRSSVTRTEAFRADGSKRSALRSRIGGYLQWPPPLELVWIWDPTERERVTAILLPGLRMVSSQPMGDLEVWIGTPSKMCSYLLDALDQNPNSGRAEILGYEVRKHTFGPDGSQEVWVAPDLDCYEMRATNWHVDRVTGKRYAARVSEVVFIAEGEPPAEYFDIPAEFRECPPSEIFRAAWQAMDPNTENNLRFYQQADEQYYRIRNRLTEGKAATDR